MRNSRSLAEPASGCRSSSLVVVVLVESLVLRVLPQRAQFEIVDRVVLRSVVGQQLDLQDGVDTPYAEEPVFRLA